MITARGWLKRVCAIAVLAADRLKMGEKEVKARCEIKIDVLARRRAFAGGLSHPRSCSQQRCVTFRLKVFPR